LGDALDGLGIPAPRKGTSPDEAAAARLEMTSTHADVTTGPLEAPLVAVSDWEGVLRHFGLDPAEFEIVDDTVRMSRWQQSKGLEDGTRSTVWLHSYSARFRRISHRLPAADVEAHRARVQSWRPRKAKAREPIMRAPATFFLGWADWQLGKSAGGGSVGTAQRVLDSFEQAERRIRELRRIGRPVERLAIWNMGDPNEGCSENYASQLFTVELTRRQQLNLALDLWTTGLRTLAPLFDDVQFGSVICNHGEWTRQGGKAVTSDSDNIGGYLADTLRRVLDGRPETAHVRWAVPHDEMSMFTDMSGVPVALTHGHRAPTGSAKEVEYLRGQSIRLLREHGREPRLWFTAHRHHYQVTDFGPWTRVQMPALDYGSKWYEDTAGHWSSPGTFSCLVGEHEAAGGPLAGHGTGFSDEMVLVAS
jgi:hypothetical protein